MDRCHELAKILSNILNVGVVKLTILVVEDEALINISTSESLLLEGYTVLSAHNADEAIRLLEARPDIRVIFTDIDMPGSMDGLKLAAAVRDRWPPVHIIVTSGKQTPRKTDMPEGATFLSKPYRHDTLFKAIQSYG